jgi:hypothetical protein
LSGEAQFVEAQEAVGEDYGVFLWRSEAGGADKIWCVREYLHDCVRAVEEERREYVVTIFVTHHSKLIDDLATKV